MPQFRSVITALCCVGNSNGIQWNSAETQIPKFITDNAPLVYLYSEERYYPGSIEDFLTHFVMSTSSKNCSTELTPSNLFAQGQAARRESNDPKADLFLTSKDQWEPEPGPDWLTKFKSNNPNLWTNKIANAEAVLIVADKPELDLIDAFWFYFYPFNLGPFVMGHGPFGNHIGDWEHSLVRFNRTTEQPDLVWISAHGGGAAFKFESLLEPETHGASRPLLFSARGTHAQYPSSGRHPHDIPWHMLSDFTDRGELWDPSLNYIAYTLNGSVVYPANGTEIGRERRYGDWLLFDGHWGNKKLDKSDTRQQWSPFEWKLIDGPTGPMFKNLERKSPCQRFKWWNYAQSCRVRKRITAGEGIEADISGCEAAIEKFPHLLRLFASILLAKGWLCFWLDRVLG